MASSADDSRSASLEKANTVFPFWTVPLMFVCLIGLLFLCREIGLFQIDPPQYRPVCLNNLKQLGLALRQYDEVRKKLTPPYLSDASGRPLISWRVLLLPWMEQQTLFDSFDLNQQWNSPRNYHAAQTRLEWLHCPQDKNAGEYDTSYVAIVGPGFLWDPQHTNSLSDIPDGAHNTIMLVEMKNSGIKWAEPRDLDLNNLPPGITKQNLLNSLSNHTGFFNVIFADGFVERMSDTVPWDDFKAMLTIAGGEKVDPDRYFVY